MLKKIRIFFQRMFVFKRSDSSGLLILILLMFMAVIFPIIYQKFLIRKHRFEQPKLESIELKLIEIKKKIDRKINKKYNKKYYNSNKKSKINTAKTKPKDAIIEPFDLNMSDTIQLKKIKGIGSVLSNRIIKYRNALGGFYDVRQLEEVYGLKKEVMSELDSLTFIGENFLLNPIYINTIEFKELLKHPYVNYNETKAILSFRWQHKKISSIDDLYRIKILDSTKIERILPYIVFENN